MNLAVVIAFGFTVLALVVLGTCADNLRDKIEELEAKTKDLESKLQSQWNQHDTAIRYLEHKIKTNESRVRSTFP